MLIVENLENIDEQKEEENLEVSSIDPIGNS